MEQPFISIIVPVYKVERYIHRCIESLTHQDFTNIEIILVDDGSPDKCGIICDEYKEKDSRIRVIHQSNGGLSAARNSGIDIAKGEYLMFVDSDDWVDSDFCSYAYQKAKESNSDIVVFGYQDEFEDKTISHTVEQEEKLSIENALVELHGGKIMSFAWNKIYNALLFEKIRYPIGRLYEDIGTTYLLFDKANSVYLAQKITYHYQQRKDSIVGREYIAKDAIDWFEQDMDRFSFIQKEYPSILKKVWYDYAKTVLLCCKILAGKKGYGQDLNLMENFLINNKQEILKSGFKDKELSLLYTSKLGFIIVRKVKAHIKQLLKY